MCRFWNCKEFDRYIICRKEIICLPSIRTEDDIRMSSYLFQVSTRTDKGCLSTAKISLSLFFSQPCNICIWCLCWFLEQLLNNVVEVLFQVAIAILLLFFVICHYWLPFSKHFFPYLVHIEKHLRLPSSSGKHKWLGAGAAPASWQRPPCPSTPPLPSSLPHTERGGVEFQYLDLDVISSLGLSLDSEIESMKYEVWRRRAKKYIP